MSNKKNMNSLLKNYSGSMDIHVANRIKISNAFNKDLVCKSPKHHALLFDNLNFESLYVSEEWIKDYIDKPDTLKLNSSNFRSDEFTKIHNGKHILFSGCSISYGTGLYSKETWPYLLYKKIKEKEIVSGYYNISIPATSIFDNVINIFKYIDSYSKPDVIFLNLPDIARFYTLIENLSSDLTEWQKKIPLDKINDFDYFKDKYFHSYCHYQNNQDSTIIYENLIYIYQYLLMLEIFCKTNNIELYLFSWSSATNNFLNRDFLELSSFHTFKHPSENWLHDYKMENKKNKFYLKARDNSHYGTAYHDFWSKKMYDIYMKGKYVN